jgi:hypothetical protein
MLPLVLRCRIVELYFRPPFVFMDWYTGIALPLPMKVGSSANMPLRLLKVACNSFMGGDARKSVSA